MWVLMKTTISAPPGRTLGFLLHDVARLLRKRFEQNARHLGLTRSQWQVLAWLSLNEGIHQGGLAELLEIEPITLARLIDKLDESGLVERRAHPTDRRIRLLYLRPAARPLMDEMWPIAADTREEALHGISARDREQLLELLALVKTNLLEASASAAAERESEASHG